MKKPLADLNQSAVVSRPRGFTLIEMMTVVGLIGLLLTITIMVTSGVIGQSKVRQCEILMKALDALLDEYESARGSMPPFDPNSYNEPRNGDAGVVRPEVSTFLVQVTGYDSANRILAGLPTDVVQTRWEYYGQTGLVAAFAGEIDARNPDDPSAANDDRLTFVDPWGIEILYIHPRDKRATIGDGEGNFAGYGRPANERPYFVSAGPDMIFYDEDADSPGTDVTRKDDIYSYSAVDRPGGE